MAIQYSGNAQTSTFTPGSKQDIINNVGAALLAAGWTTASGGTGTTSWLLQSATTPQGYSFRVLMQDNGGNCVTFSLQSSNGALVGGNSTTVGGGFLIPGSYTYRIVCNKYQAFVYATPNPNAPRTFVAFGVPYVPSWVAPLVTQLAWMQGNASSDTDSSVRSSFRTGLNNYNSTNNQALFNGALWQSTTGGNPGVVSLWQYSCPVFGNAGYLWQNGASLLVDAVIGWGDTTPSQALKAKGQLWDAVQSTDAYPGDTVASFDSHNWICLTDNNTSTTERGTLLLATS